MTCYLKVVCSNPASGIVFFSFLFLFSSFHPENIVGPIWPSSEVRRCKPCKGHTLFSFIVCLFGLHPERVGLNIFISFSVHL